MNKTYPARRCAMFGALLLILVGLAAAQTTRPSDRAGDEDCSAKIIVHLDPQALSARAIYAQDVEAALGRFYASHNSFQLDELRSLRLVSATGKQVELKEIAKVEVDFRRLNGAAEPSDKKS